MPAIELPANYHWRCCMCSAEATWNMRDEREANYGYCTKHMEEYMQKDDPLKYYRLGQELAQIVYDEVSTIDEFPWSHGEIRDVWAGMVSKFEKWESDEDERVSAGWDND